MDTNFTAKEKVLVHLLDHYGEDEGYALPVEITQEGIADSLGLKQNTVSYAVRNLVKEDMLREETRRIKDKKQKRKAYFLTDSGFEEAKKTKKKMANTEVEVASDQEKSPIKLGEINAYYQTNYSLLEILQKIKEKGRFEPEEKSKERDLKNHFYHMPAVIETEHPQFSEIVDSWKEGYDLIPIIGKEGTGKTTLLSKMGEYLKGKLNVFYFEVKEWQEPMHLWRALVDFLEKCGNHRLSSYLKSEEEMDRKERLVHLMKDIKETKTLFLIDDIDKNEDISEIISKMLVSEECPCTIIITEDPDRPDSGLEKSNEIHLDPNNLLFSSLDEFYEHGEDGFSIDDILDMRITDEEFWALALLSTFRIPVEKDALSMIEPVTENMVNSILQTPLVYSTTDKKIGVHDIVRKKILERLSISQKCRIHSIASEYYMEKTSLEAEHSIEKINHLVSARQYEDFKEVLKEEWEEILALGYYDSVIELIEKVEDEHEAPYLSYIKGEAYKKKTDYEKAEDSYQQAIESNGDTGLVTEAHIGLASTLERQEKPSEAISEYKTALKSAEDIENSSEKKRCKGKILFRMGALLSDTGEYSQAEEYLSNAIEILSEDEHSLLTTAYFVMAKIKKLGGDWSDSISYFDKGLKHWKRIEETYKRVGGLEDIGSFYTILRELNSAEEYLKEAIEASERFGYRDLKASALISLAEYHLEKRMIDEAIEAGTEAKELLEELGDEKKKALTHTLLGNAYTIKDNTKKAEKNYNKAISIYQKTGASYRLGLAYFSLAKLQEKKGNKAGIAENYRKAILSFSGSGANWMAEKIEKRIEGIPVSI
ncbi:MAG: tetratricopeptide repeat protein [Thermoplasmata archaeon]